MLWRNEEKEEEEEEEEKIGEKRRGTPPKADSREANASLQGQVSYLVND